MFVDDAFVQAGKIYTFGGKHSRYGFRVVAPFGAEAIKAVASTNQLDSLLASDKKSEDSEAYLNNFHTKMRGIKVIPNPGQPAQWAEAAFGLTTVSKSALAQSQLLSSVRGRK